MTKFGSKLSYIWKNRHYFFTFQKLRQLKFDLSICNHLISRLSPQKKIFHQRIQDFNHCVILLQKVKWGVYKAVQSSTKENWQDVQKKIKNCAICIQKLKYFLINKLTTDLGYSEIVLKPNNSEIFFADDTPIYPEISPIVILQGSDYEMGVQYAEQLTQIYGDWILTKGTQKSLTPESIEILKKWEQNLIKYAPEIIEFCQGWSEVCKKKDILLDYYQILDLWTGHTPPAENYFGFGSSFPENLPEPACSGIAIWDTSKSTEELFTISSGDHDSSSIVTLLVYPKTGNNFILTLFAATGYISLVGQQFMFGHPGLNDKGVIYVHHGGEPKMVEPKNKWDYGIRRGASIFHVLRYSNSAKEALEMELNFPIGDVGRPNGSSGGFYADSNFGYVLEARDNPPIVREPIAHENIKFLYATNNPMSELSKRASWDHILPNIFNWTQYGGISPSKPRKLSLFSQKNMDIKSLNSLAYMYFNSFWRNLNIHQKIVSSNNLFSEPQLISWYQDGGTIDSYNFKENMKKYNETGKWGNISVGNASNALIGVINLQLKTYSICVGPAKRGILPNSPNGSNPIYNETNQFWEISLRDSVKSTIEYAREKINGQIDTMKKIDNSKFLNLDDEIMSKIQILKSEIFETFQKGEDYYNSAVQKENFEKIYDFSKSLRYFTHAQVRALQFLDFFK